MRRKAQGVVGWDKFATFIQIKCPFSSYLPFSEQNMKLPVFFVIIFSWGVREPCSVPYTPHTPVTLLTVTICGTLRARESFPRGTMEFCCLLRCGAQEFRSEPRTTGWNSRKRKRSARESIRKQGGGKRSIVARACLPAGRHFLSAFLSCLEKERRQPSF